MSSKQDPLTKHIRQVLKGYGDQAGEQFGVNQGRLNGYIKRGHYPLPLVGRILDKHPFLAGMNPEAPSQMPQRQPPRPAQPPQQPNHQQATPPPTQGASIDKRVFYVENYITTTVDFYLRQYASRLDMLEKTIDAMRARQLRAAGMSLSSLARPDAGVPADQTFTTNPYSGMAPVDSGFAPTKAQVDAQAGVYSDHGVFMPQAQLAGPAQPMEQPPFGFGWNTPRPSR